MTALVFVFLLAVPAFGGIEVEVTAKTRDACEQARAAIRKQLLQAGVQHTLTRCTERPAA